MPARQTCRCHAAPHSPKPKAIVVGDVETIAGARHVAAEVNAHGRFDAVIHNAAVGYRESHRVHGRRPAACLRDHTLSALYPDGADSSGPSDSSISAPACITMPTRTSTTFPWKKRRWTVRRLYAESKLHTRCSPSPSRGAGRTVFSKSLEPGWVPTKTCGLGAPDDMDQAT